MKYKGFSDKTVKWFYSYLKNKAFSNSLENVVSKEKNRNCGVFQGFIIEPLLLLLCINNISQALPNIHT